MNAAWAWLPAFVQKHLAGRLTLQKTLGNTGWMTAEQVARMGVGLVVGVWLARYLGPERYGDFSYATAFATIFSPLATLGLHEILVRDLVREPSGQDEILGTSFLLMMIGGVAVFVLTMSAVFLMRPGDSEMQWLVGISMAGTLLQGFSVIESWYSARLQAKYWVITRVGALFAASLAKCWLIVVHAPLVAFAWAGLAELALGAAGLTVVYQRSGHRFANWRFDRIWASRLVKDGWPLMFALGLNLVYLRIDQLMLGEMAGSNQLGMYSAAVRISEMGAFIPAVICASVFPVIVAAVSADDAFYDHMQRLYNLVVLIGYVIAIAVTLFSKVLVALLYGPAFSGAAPLLSVLVWAGVFTGLSSAHGIFMISRNWNRLYLVCMLLGCLLNVGLNWVLIPSMGAMGAVLASCFSYWFAVHGTCFLFKPLRKNAWMMAKAMLYPKPW